ncbi:MAG: lip3 [Gammaproteobacteria bacterium]|nr:lip3 [Gammaproteobacteria bacterium]
MPNPQKIISYIDSGKGQTLVLIHPFPTDKTLWTPQQAELQKKFRVISIDLWGFGQSTLPEKNVATMTDYANEVKQLLDSLHIQQAIIGGESMGGYVALALLAKYPNTVKGLILSGTQAIASDQKTKQEDEDEANYVQAHGTEKLIKDFLPKALSPHASIQAKRTLLTIVERQHQNAVAAALRGIATRQDTSNVLAATNLPVLILTGNQDAVIPADQSEAIHKLAKNSKLVVFKNVGHLASLEQPKAWNKAVIDYFAP